MEFPDVGKQCSEPTCRQLDFLPIKCDACEKTFCNDHYSYLRHQCSGAYKKDVQIPICPLCNTPIPGKSTELPDIRVSRHIDADCRSDQAVNRRNKVFTNRCSKKGCKQKELIPVLCSQCNLNFCLKHRHTADHDCEPPKNEPPMKKSGLAALTRHLNYGKSDSSSTSVSTSSSSQARRSQQTTTLQGNMSEEEAMRLAMQASLQPQSSSARSVGTPCGSELSQEQEDFLLAKAIAESEREASTVGGENHRSGNRRGNNCGIV